MSAQILLVEDDDTLGMTLEMTLSASGHRVTLAATLADARRAVEAEPPELVVLDLGLPDGDGLDLLSEMRLAGNDAAVLILTARGTLRSRVQGLNLGADDYLTKPFELPELLARVGALLRRHVRAKAEPERVRVGALEVDMDRLRAWRNGEELVLTELEHRLLRFMVERRGEVVSRELLLAAVWGVDPTTRTRTVDVFMGRLRRHIELDPAQPRTLLSVRGIGYRLAEDAEAG